jgi:lipid II:glycine glycyltransferase (peptidoglycan interpeptide bridge formation enzyme)
VSGRYASRVSFETHDPTWDEFVRAAPGGHYMQDGAWASFKLAFNWRVARVTLLRGAEVVGGAQLLLRRLPRVGAVGWAPKAPVVADSDPELMERILGELRRLVQRERVRVLLMQPPPQPAALPDVLQACGYSSTPVTMGPEATILLSLDRDLDAILSATKTSTRRNIRLAFRKGVTVREGDEADLETFYRLHEATGDRQSFSPYPERHFAELWRAFRPAGGVRLFLAEYDGEPVSGLLALAHGQTVSQHAMGWSGRHANVKPNEAAVWGAIAWSKERGYPTFDFTWIDARAAHAVARGEPLPADLEQSVAKFKLGFGGAVTLLPRPYAYVDDPALRAAFRSLAPLAYRLRGVQNAHHRLRWRWLSSRTDDASRGA